MTKLSWLLVLSFVVVPVVAAPQEPPVVVSGEGDAGDIESVTAGDGLSGGGVEGDVTLSLNTAFANLWTADQSFQGVGLAFDAATAGDSEFWLALRADDDGMDDDALVVGAGTTPSASDWLYVLGQPGHVGTLAGLVGTNSSYSACVPLAFTDVNNWRGLCVQNAADGQPAIIARGAGTGNLATLFLRGTGSLTDFVCIGMEGLDGWCFRGGTIGAGGGDFEPLADAVLNIGAPALTIRDVFVESVVLKETNAQPTCSSAERGRLWLVTGGAGVADALEACLKDAGDAYAWRTVFSP